jgi:hypothetical protein
LVIEGGFSPDAVTPQPPLRVAVVGRGKNRRHRLHSDGESAGTHEQTVLGGLKTKDVDVVVSTRELGPCLAVSLKGTTNAFRNLTNRMEEAAGDCTNLHITYPALVYGFLHILRANRQTDGYELNDVAIDASNSVVDAIVRYHDAVARLTRRSDIRNEVSRYEAIALALVETGDGNTHQVFRGFPDASSPLYFDHFFQSLYDAYDRRFVYPAPSLEKTTKRIEWASDSPAIDAARQAGFTPRIDHSS